MRQILFEQGRLTDEARKWLDKEQLMSAFSATVIVLLSISMAQRSCSTLAQRVRKGFRYRVGSAC